ncbi:hypothetical protein EJB05_33491, partial [Eragrostis curvula]
MKCPNAQA